MKYLRIFPSHNLIVIISSIEITYRDGWIT